MNHIDSCLVGVITEYDESTSLATILPIVKDKKKDSSSLALSEITDVPIITPATAYAGLKLPVRIGDKVVLHVVDRDINTLLKKYDSSGLEVPDTQTPTYRRRNNINDCVAYTGFFTEQGAFSSNGDLKLFNNSDSDSLNKVEIKEDGSILVSTSQGNVNIEKGGSITVNATAVTVNSPTSTINGNVQVNGTITCSDDVIANGISLVNHVHGGVLSGGASTSPPVGA